MVLRNPKRTQPREVVNEVLRTLHLFAVLREKTTARKQIRILLVCTEILQPLRRFSSLLSDVAKQSFHN